MHQVPIRMLHAQLYERSKGDGLPTVGVEVGLADGTWVQHLSVSQLQEKVTHTTTYSIGPTGVLLIWEATTTMNSSDGDGAATTRPVIAYAPHWWCSVQGNPAEQRPNPDRTQVNRR